MIKRKLWTWLKNGSDFTNPHITDECHIEIVLNTWRWFLLLGYEGRRHKIATKPGMIQKRTSIGFLCIMVIYTRFNRSSPYTQSCKEDQGCHQHKEH